MQLKANNNNDNNTVVECRSLERVWMENRIQSAAKELEKLMIHKIQTIEYCCVSFDDDDFLKPPCTDFDYFKYRLTG